MYGNVILLKHYFLYFYILHILLFYISVLKFQGEKKLLQTFLMTNTKTGTYIIH